MKFTISDQPQAIDSLLRNCIGDFLKTLEDPDLNVRRVALVAFNSAAHNKPSLIRDLLPTVLPHLYNETQVRNLNVPFPVAIWKRGRQRQSEGQILWLHNYRMTRMVTEKV